MKIILKYLLILFIMWPVYTQSQEPSPAPRPIGRYQQPAPTGPGNKGSQHQHVLPNSATLPLQDPAKEVVVGKMGNQNSAKQRQNVNQCSSQNNLLDIFSTILITLATVVIAAFTYRLYRINKELFIVTHRPKLRVHSIYLEKLSSPQINLGVSHITHKIHCSIDNIGVSNATIKKKSLTFKRLNEPLPVPSYGTPQLIEENIASGGSVTKSIDVEDALIWGSMDRVVNDLYFFGYIDYVDDIGTTSRTAFCRRYIRETRRFAKVEDEDYEYSY